jgi:hypothetical protein
MAKRTSVRRHIRRNNNKAVKVKKHIRKLPDQGKLLDREEAYIHDVFLKHSQPAYHDYEWDGKILTVYVEGENEGEWSGETEKYTRKELIEDGYLPKTEKELKEKGY